MGQNLECICLKCIYGMGKPDRVNFKYELYDKDNDKLFCYSRAFLMIKGVVMSLIMQVLKYLFTYLVHVQCNKISFGFVCMTASE